jgi:hypothetical protein
MTFESNTSGSSGCRPKYVMMETHKEPDQGNRPENKFLQDLRKRKSEFESTAVKHKVAKKPKNKVEGHKDSLVQSRILHFETLASDKISARTSTRSEPGPRGAGESAASHNDDPT